MEMRAGHHAGQRVSDRDQSFQTGHHVIERLTKERTHQQFTLQADHDVRPGSLTMYTIRVEAPNPLLRPLSSSVPGPRIRITDPLPVASGLGTADGPFPRRPIKLPGSESVELVAFLEPKASCRFRLWNLRLRDSWPWRRLVIVRPVGNCRDTAARSIDSDRKARLP